MPCLPRLALGTIAPTGVSVVAGIWAFLAALRQRDASVQPFLAQACFLPQLTGGGLSGRLPRHLDSWLMSEANCRELFAHGASGCDLAVVLGTFDRPNHVSYSDAGSSFDTLCRWLDLPRLAAIDVATLSDCAAPARPGAIDGVLLYGDAQAAEMARWRTQVETLWSAPVVGAIALPKSLIRALGKSSPGVAPNGDIVRGLAACASESVAWDRVWALAARRPIAAAPVELFAQDKARLGGVRVAIAFDEALCCYFPDVLELLELRGATVLDFSPLKDDRLPEATEVVYLGCGHPELFARQLADNDCLKLALREHCSAGRRMYAEGGAAALLAESIELSDGARHSMAGVLPLTLRAVTDPKPPRPSTTTLNRDCWMGRRGTILRGYENPLWTFDVPQSQEPLGLTNESHPALLIRGETIVSRLHLNFAAMLEIMAGLTAPLSRPVLALSGV